MELHDKVWLVQIYKTVNFVLILELYGENCKMYKDQNFFNKLFINL